MTGSRCTVYVLAVISSVHEMCVSRLLISFLLRQVLTRNLR